MKQILMQSRMMLLFAAVLAFGACSDEPEETVAAPVVAFSEAESELSMSVDEPLVIDAEVENGVAASFIWYVNGVQVSAEATLNHTFTQVGYYTVRCEVYNEGGRTARVYKVRVNGIPLEVEYSVPGESISCDQGDEVRISVTVTGGDKEVQHLWSLGDEVISEQSEFVYTFLEAGDFTLTYTGTNADKMTATKSWQIHVAEVELPLTIEFTPVPGEISCHEGDEVVIAMSVKGGADGLVHSWKVDGSEVSTGAEFRQRFSEMGTYTITYSGVNAKQESLERTWTLLVSHLVEDLESAATLPSILVDQNASLSVVANPHVTAVNGSAKVLKSDMSSSSNSTSGRFWLDVSAMSDLASYGAVRVKVWIGANSYIPYLQLLDQAINRRPTTVNGSTYETEEEWRRLVRTDEWNILVYDLPQSYGKENLEGVITLDFRPMSDFDGNNAPIENNDRILYYDDFEFLK